MKSADPFLKGSFKDVWKQKLNIYVYLFVQNLQLNFLPNSSVPPNLNDAPHLDCWLNIRYVKKLIF